MRSRIVGQLEYVAAEIESLRTLLPRIHESILIQKPIDGGRSIAGNFAHMVERQGTISLIDKPLPEAAADPATVDEVDGILQQFLDERGQLMAAIAEMEDDVWNESEDRGGIGQELYQIVLQESEILREIAIRLHESNMFRL